MHHTSNLPRVCVSWDKLWMVYSLARCSLLTLSTHSWNCLTVSWKFLVLVSPCDSLELCWLARSFTSLQLLLRSPVRVSNHFLNISSLCSLRSLLRSFRLFTVVCRVFISSSTPWDTSKQIASYNFVNYSKTAITQ